MNWIIKKTFCWISCHSLMGWISFPVNKLFFHIYFIVCSAIFHVTTKILTNVRVILVNMVELVLTLLVDFVVNAHQNGLVTYAKLVSPRKIKMFLQSTRKKNWRKTQNSIVLDIYQISASENGIDNIICTQRKWFLIYFCLSNFTCLA